MARTNLYLHFPGTAEEAFAQYKTIFGVDFTTITRLRDTPGGELLPPGEADKIMHIALPLDGGSLLMGSDVPEFLMKEFVVGTNFTVSVDAGSREEADRLFTALSEGGKTELPMADAFWGAYFGMCTDRWSIPWMVSYDPRSTGAGSRQ